MTHQAREVERLRQTARSPERRYHVSLYLAVHRAGPEAGGDGACSSVGRGSEAILIPRFDFVPQRRPLAEADGRITMRRRSAAPLDGVDLDMGKAGCLEIVPNPRDIVIAVRRSRQEARRIVRENTRQGLRHDMGKFVLLDTVP